MKYISVDIETTGLDASTSDIIEFAAIYDDTERPLDECKKFQSYIKPANGQYLRVWPANLTFNQPLYDVYNRWVPSWASAYENNMLDIVGLRTLLIQWFLDLGFDTEKDRFTVAGKNFVVFDYSFLKDIFSFTPQYGMITLRHRTLDLGSMFLLPGDREIPNTDECLKRAKINKTAYNHRALDDALMVCKLVRFKLTGEQL